jgi:RNA polymerase sigma-70 factor, ECF subfamily
MLQEPDDPHPAFPSGTSSSAEGDNGRMQPSDALPLDEVGRRAAFATYVEPEIPVLLRVARSLTGSAADAEDLVQETLIRAYRAMEQFDGAHPRAWLLTILRNTASNLRRRTRPDLVEDWDALSDPKPAFGAERPETPQEAALAGVLDADLEEAIASLGEKFSSVLVMVDVHGLSYAECAEALGIPVGTVMSRLSRARDRMRKHLKASGRLS